MYSTAFCKNTLSIEFYFIPLKHQTHADRLSFRRGLKRGRDFAQFSEVGELLLYITGCLNRVGFPTDDASNFNGTISPTQLRGTILR
jgi:hypothetical protein